MLSEIIMYPGVSASDILGLELVHVSWDNM